MTQMLTDMALLYDRLSHLGFSKAFLRQYALPDWWDEQFEETPGAVVEAAAYISRRFNLDLHSLLQFDKTPEFKQSCQTKFKTKQGTQHKQLQVAQCMAERIAKMVVYACIPTFKSLPDSAQQVRSEILNATPTNGERAEKFVSLNGLLNWCWQAGIPVVHFDRFPKAKGIHKFQGMVASFYDRPVIILSLNTQFTAQLLFILAHELGHLVRGHLKDTSIVDEVVEPGNLDDEEIEANEFAVELLLGKPDMAYYTPRYLSGDELAEFACRVSVRDRVDPGVVVLNYAWNKVNMVSIQSNQQTTWATATKALKIIERGMPVKKEVNNLLARKLDWEKLDEDSQDYLSLVTEG
ncbi:MAG: ImmA/IrrE family metallo-endopeptidase [Cyanobacteriota bacterium]|nr:ImmA/IrrE family metallo-endopeptidase [Cyanobacteriota bacterium]